MEKQEIFNILSFLLPIVGAFCGINSTCKMVISLGLTSVLLSWMSIYYAYLELEPFNVNGAAGATVSILGWVPGLLLFIIAFFVLKICKYFYERK